MLLVESLACLECLYQHQLVMCQLITQQDTFKLKDNLHRLAVLVVERPQSHFQGKRVNNVDKHL